MPAGFISEWWPASNRNAGRHQIGIGGRIESEFAGWHQRGQSLIVPKNITLLSLPPYSPELNPMENVWAYLRQNKLCALVWNTYEEILDACQSAWRFLIDDPDRIRSIGIRHWACVNI